MNKSDSITKIAAALAKAQRNIGAASKESKNPFFKSSYADLGSVMEAVKAELLDQDISVLQPVGHTGDGLTYVETILLHSSGEFISDQMLVTCAKEKDPQAQGSAISYARRYSLQSMLFVPAEDDDGEGAKGRKPIAPDKPSATAMLEAELKKLNRTTEDFMGAMKYKGKIPDKANDFHAMKEETASKFLAEIGYVLDDIIEWKALKE